MAKKRTKQEKKLTRKQIAFSKQDQKREHQLLIAAAIVGGIIVLVLAFGLVQVFILQPQAPVATVNGKSISTDDYQKSYSFQNFQLQRSLQQMMQQQAQFFGNEDQQFMYDYLQQNIDQLQARQQALPQSVLNDMIDDELIQEEIERLGITVSDAEVQAQIEKEFGYDPNPPTPTATPTLTATQVITLTPTPTPEPMTEVQFQQIYKESLAQFSQMAGFQESDVRALFRGNLLREKLQEHLEADVPTTEEQILPSHILIRIEEPEFPEGEETPTPEEQVEARIEADAQAKAKAEEVLERVLTGDEDFEVIALEVSDDPGSKEEGGNLGWHPRGEMVAEFEEVAFSLEPGEIYTDVVKSQFGYHIIKLEDYDPERELEDYALEQRKSIVLQQWLAEQEETADIERLWSADKVPTAVPMQAPLP